MEVLASALSLILQPCYELSHNWWVAILLFTVIVKVILLPMSLWCQKNSIAMVQLMPDLYRIKVKYFGDKEVIGEKQNDLYKEKHYHPLLSLVPLAVQILILFGLVDVIHTITDNGAPGTEFLGLVPSEDGGLSWIMPLLAGLSAVLMGYAQNRIHPLQKEQSAAEKNMTNGLSIALSFFLGIFVAAGMAFYWVCSNLTSIAVQALCNVVMKPGKYINYDDLQAARAEFEALDSLSSDRGKWWQRDPLAKREKADYKRFFSIVDKHIVFLSEGSGFYKYFEGAIDWVLNHSSACVHYITNDPDDQIFDIAKAKPRILPYYIGEKKLITLMMKMDADIVVLTLEDLENYYIKRSYVRKDVEYVFMPHHMTSMHLVSKKGAFDHYDTVLCVGPHQVKELKRSEELYQTRRKKLVECGYDLIDANIDSYEKRLAGGGAVQECAANGCGSKTAVRPQVLIAPSWQEDCLLDSCADEVIGSLLGRGFRVVVRPHPEYVKRRAPKWEALQARFAHVPDDELRFEKDFSSNASVFGSDVLITDWSSVFCEFAFSTLKPCVFIDTPMKVGNSHYEDLQLVPTDIQWRSQVGMSFKTDNLDALGEGVQSLIDNQPEWTERIRKVRSQSIFNLGHGAEVAGEYLISSMVAKQEARREGASDAR